MINQNVGLRSRLAAVLLLSGVSAVSLASAAQAEGQSKVKLNGHGQSTVTLYARPDFGAPISGMGVSGEVVNKQGCKASGDLTWCRVGYPGQTARNLWVPAGSLTFLGDGE